MAGSGHGLDDLAAFAGRRLDRGRATALVREVFSQIVTVGEAWAKVDELHNAWQGAKAQDEFGEVPGGPLLACALVDEWCRLKSIQSSMALAEHISERSIVPAEEHQARLGKHVVLRRAEFEARYVSIALQWLVDLAVSRSRHLDVGLCPDLVDLACDLTAPEEHRDSAMDWLRTVAATHERVWSDLIEGLADRPAEGWPAQILSFTRVYRAGRPGAREVRLSDDLAREVRRRLTQRHEERERCLLGPDAHCTRGVVPSPDEVFVAHAYTDETRESLRKMVSRLRERLPRMVFTRAEEVPVVPGITLACNVCECIRRCGHILCDLTPGRAGGGDPSDAGRPNPNVAFETGLAFGYGKKPLLILKEGCEPLTDIEGHLFIPFAEYTDAKLVDRLVEALAPSTEQRTSGGT